MEKYIVYITINLCNGKFYIGVHKTNPETFDGYIGLGIYRQNQANKEYPFHRAVKKYGYTNFKRTTIAVFDTAEEAYALEASIVNSTLLKSKSCYNVQVGGLGGTSNINSKKVYQFALNGSFIKEWNSIHEAEVTLQLHHIGDVCIGNRDSAGGYYWNFEKKFQYTPYVGNKIIAQYTISGKFIRTWISQKEAQRELGLVNLHTAIKMHRVCGNYQWREFNGNTSDIPPIVTRKTMYQQYYSIIEQYDSEGNFIKEWQGLDSLHLAGYNRRYVRQVIKGYQKTYKGYVFKIKEDSDIVSTSNESQSSENGQEVTNPIEDN